MLNPDGYTTSEEQKILEITVKRGWKEGTKITFAKEGHQSREKVPADIVFVIKDKQHPLFKRDKDNNLLYTARISLREALTGTQLEIKTISGKSIQVPIDEIVTPTSTKIIRSGGLPLPKHPEQIGDLLISFDIQFPNHLPIRTKEALLQLLPK